MLFKILFHFDKIKVFIVVVILLNAEQASGHFAGSLCGRPSVSSCNSMCGMPETNEKVPAVFMFQRLETTYLLISLKCCSFIGMLLPIDASNIFSSSHST